MKHIFFVLLALYFTLASSQQQYVVTVGSSASANYATINAALSSVKSGVTWEVRIEPGVYTEQLIVNRPNGIIRALGEPGSVVVRFPGLRNTRDNATVSINQPHVKMYGITMHQMMPEEAGIAITLIVFASNVSFYECNILGFQDTLWFRNSRSIAYFKDCYIEGGVDFIYGSGLGYFDNCTLASNKRGGCISALQGGQATLKDKFIFNFCKLIPTIPSTLLSPYANTNLSYTDPSQFEKANYLGRPWDTFSRVIFMYSEMANHINPAGWSTWSGRVGYYYREYNNTGPGGVFGVDRVDFTSLLTPDEGVSLTFAAMFGSQNPYWVDSNYGPTMCPGEGDQCGGADFTGLACCQFPFSCVSSASGNPTCQYVAPVARDNGTVEVSTISSESLTSLTINNAFGSVSAAYDGAGSSIVVTADYTNAISTSIGLSASSSSEYDVTYSPLSDPRGVAIDIQVQLPADSSVVVPGSGVLPPCLASLELSVVNSWISNGVTYQQYQIRFTNTGSLVVSSVTAQLTISDQSTIGQYWNIYPSGNGVYSFPDYYKWHTYQIGGNAQDSGFILSGPAPLSASISVASLTCSL